MTTPAKPVGLELLRQPFPDHLVSLLPKPTAKREEMDKLPKANCSVCGGYHATSRIIHLSYVGHAALTDRLLDCDPAWTWDPVAVDDVGLPKLSADGLLWIRLTVCGVTRMGVGDAAPGKASGDAMKERIGDALRNAGMRFGAGLEFWHKGDLHAVPPGGAVDDGEEAGGGAVTRTAAPEVESLDYPADRFETNLPSWTAVLASGRRTVDDLVKMVESSGGYLFTDSQKHKLRNVKPASAKSAEKAVA